MSPDDSSTRRFPFHFLLKIKRIGRDYEYVKVRGEISTEYRRFYHNVKVIANWNTPPETTYSKDKSKHLIAQTMIYLSEKIIWHYQLIIWLHHKLYSKSNIGLKYKPLMILILQKQSKMRQWIIFDENCRKLVHQGSDISSICPVLLEAAHGSILDPLLYIVYTYQIIMKNPLQVQYHIIIYINGNAFVIIWTGK